MEEQQSDTYNGERNPLTGELELRTTTSVEATPESTERLARLALVGMIESRQLGSTVRAQEQYRAWSGTQ